MVVTLSGIANTIWSGLRSIAIRCWGDYKYPEKWLEPGNLFYRVRKAPANPNNHGEYDSPPIGIAGSGRLDSEDFRVLYASPDLEVCVHECRFSPEDELYVATLNTTKPLRLLNLAAILEEEVTEFESLDISINMLS